MTPDFQAALRSLSLQGAQVASEIQVFVTNAVHRQGGKYLPASLAESQRLPKLLRARASEDIQKLLDGIGDSALRTFALTEKERRDGAILGWVFRGMFASIQPDIGLIAYATPEEGS